MSQIYDEGLIVPATTSPAVDIQRIKDSLQALRSFFSGPSEPSSSYQVAHMPWADTANGLLKIRNASNTAWITVGSLSATNLGLLALSGGNLTGGVNAAKTSVASAASPDIFAATVGNMVDYTGTATATGFATAPQAGAMRWLVCAATPSFTAGSNLLIDGVTSGSTITLAAGDKCLVIAVTTTQFRMTVFPASGAATFKTGRVMLMFDDTPDNGWVLMNDGTIGSASSGATTRANADTQALYTLLWTKCSDQWAPVTGGRGASAAADFAANKAMKLPRALGRALAVYGAGGITASGTGSGVNTTTDAFTVPANNQTWVTGMAVVFTLSSGTITGLSSGSTYYVVRSSSTTVKLASSLGNAQNGTVIDLTGASSPVWTLTHSYLSRAMGEQAGQDEHAQTTTELLAHAHGYINPVPSGGGQPVAGGGTNGLSQNTGTTGGNVAMAITQATLYLNAQIKL